MPSLPKTINEVIDCLQEIIKNAANDGNRIGYFAALYLRVTIEIRDKIDVNYFENNQLIEQLDVVFANRFLEAYYDNRDQKIITKSWQAAFNAANRWPPVVLQHLFLGMNAHIGLDLGIAAANVCPAESINMLYNDFNKVNSVLSSLVNMVQIDLAKIWPLFIFIDWFAGKLDEGLANFSIEIARDAAWKVALEYAKITEIENKVRYIKQRDEKVATFSNKLYKPGKMLRLLIMIIRISETGTVKSKIRKLTQ
jgi:hypothetical protein